MSAKPVLQGEYMIGLGVGGDTIALWIKCSSSTHADTYATKIMQQIKEGRIEIELPNLKTTTY